MRWRQLPEQQGRDRLPGVRLRRVLSSWQQRRAFVSVGYLQQREWAGIRARVPHVSAWPRVRCGVRAAVGVRSRQRRTLCGHQDVLAVRCRLLPSIRGGNGLHLVPGLCVVRRRQLCPHTLPCGKRRPAAWAGQQLRVRHVHAGLLVLGRQGNPVPKRYPQQRDRPARPGRVRVVSAQLLHLRPEQDCPGGLHLLGGPLREFYERQPVLHCLPRWCQLHRARRDPGADWTKPECPHCLVAPGLLPI